MLLRLVPLLLALVATGAAAESDSERADRLRHEARALRAQAEETYRIAEPACYERFLVNRCLAQAKEERLERIRAARELENEAVRIGLARKQQEAAASGRAATDAPTEPAAPLPPEATEVRPDEAAEAIRARRADEAVRAEAEAAERQARRDEDKARERARAEAAAARRAEQAERDRARYEERLRKREARQAEE